MTTIDRRYSVSEGTAIKAPCRVATTANISLTGLQTIDGITLVEHDRVLVKDQSDQTTNGIYEASSGNWSRTKDFDGAYDIVCGTRVDTTDGTVGGDRTYSVATANPITIGTSNITFTDPHVLAGPPGVSGGTQQYFTTRTQAIGTSINTGLTVITIGAYDSTSAFALAYYKPGTSAGILAFQDASGNWWELDATGQILNIAWFGGTPSNATKNTTAANAIAALSGAYSMRVPRGTWLFNDTVTFAQSNQRVIGDGQGLTTLTFQPGTQHQAFLKWANPASTYPSYGGASGLKISRSTTGIVANAIELQNTSIFDFDDILISGWHDSAGGASKGFYLRGREITTITRASVDADYPVYVAENPERGSVLEIDCDFLTLREVQLSSAASASLINSPVTILDGVNVTNFTIDGFDLGGGLHGIEWTTTTDTIAQAQSRGAAGNLTLNGTLVSAGTGTFAINRKLGITSAGNNTGVNFTITGTDASGNAQVETRAGPNATTVFTTGRWKTITQIATNAATVGNVWCGKAPESVNSGFVVRNGRQEGQQTTGGAIVFHDRQNAFELRGVVIDQILASYVGVHLTGNIAGISVQSLYHGGTLSPFVLDASISGFSWHGCIFQSGTASGVSGQTEVGGWDKRASEPHSRNGHFVKTSGGSQFLRIADTTVVGPRITGWDAPVGTQTRGAFTVAGATTASNAQALAALIADLRTHGLIGT